MAKTASHRALLLVRSGQTDWDLAGRVQGSTDLPLSPQGRAEVESEIAQIGNVHLAAVLSAPDEASRQTAELLAGGSKIIVVPALAEPHVGLWEGLLKSDLQERFCRAGRQWGDDPCSVTPPEGESIEAAAIRILPALGKAISKVKVKPDPAIAGSIRSGVGLVLRPIADAIVRCSVADLPTSELCGIIRSRPAPEWVEVPVGFDWTRPVRPRPATASVA